MATMTPREGGGRPMTPREGGSPPAGLQLVVRQKGKAELRNVAPGPAFATEALPSFACDPDAVLAPNAFQREGRCRALRPEDQAARDAVAMQSADLLVCDINTHPDQCASLCRSLLPLLKPGGKLILTLKFTGTRRDRADRVANCAEILGPTVTDVKALWLFANTVCERTLCATKVG